MTRNVFGMLNLALSIYLSSLLSDCLHLRFSRALNLCTLQIFVLVIINKLVTGGTCYISHENKRDANC